MSKTQILGVWFDNVTQAQATGRVLELLRGEGSSAVVTPNPEMVMHARTDKSFRNVLNNAGLVVPDGIGIVLASRLLGGGLRERVAGIELIQNVLEICGGCRVFLVGGRPGVAALAAKKLKILYPEITIVGHRHGFFGDNEEAGVVADVRAAGVDILLVGLGFPRQEKFIAKNLPSLGVKVALGCGGSIDVFAGKVSRAPKVFQLMGLEWLYRLVRQPTRFSRMLCLPKFVLCIIREVIKKT